MNAGSALERGRESYATDVVVADSEPDPIARILKFDERFFRLRRR